MMYMQVSSRRPASMQLGMLPTLRSGNSWHPHILSGCQNSALLLSKPEKITSLSRGAYAIGIRSDVMLVLILVSCFITMGSLKLIMVEMRETDNEGKKTREESNEGR